MLTDWMANLPESARQRSVKDLVIPGSHDAGAYSVALHEWSKVSAIGAFFWALAGITAFTVTELVTRASQTQYTSIYDQLCAGSRFLDIRAQKWDGDGEFYIYHGEIPIVGATVWMTVKLETVINDILRFSTAHKSELVVVALSLTSDSNGAELAKVKETLSDRLLEQFEASMSLDDIQRTGRNVVLAASGNSACINLSGIYDGGVHEPREIENYYFRHLADMPKDKMWVWHINPPYAITKPLTSLYDYAKCNFDHLLPRISGDAFKGKLPNIVNLDFMTEFKWAEPLINLNNR